MIHSKKRSTLGPLSKRNVTRAVLAQITFLSKTIFAQCDRVGDFRITVRFVHPVFRGKVGGRVFLRMCLR